MTSSEKHRATQKLLGIKPPDEPNHDVECIICCSRPTVGDTELCGPCCFGESDTMNGNW